MGQDMTQTSGCKKLLPRRRTLEAVEQALDDRQRGHEGTKQCTKSARVSGSLAGQGHL